MQKMTQVLGVIQGQGKIRVALPKLHGSQLCIRHGQLLQLTTNNCQGANNSLLCIAI